MAYVVAPVDTPIYYVPDSDLATYNAAGWVTATSLQINAYHSADPYNGTQLAPPAPPLLAKNKAPAPAQATRHIH